MNSRPNPSTNRRLIASYDKDRLLVDDLCDRNQDEWMVGSLLNAADLLSALLGDLMEGRALRAKACNGQYCIEVVAYEGGFLAYEVPNDECENQKTP